LIVAPVWVAVAASDRTMVALVVPLMLTIESPAGRSGPLIHSPSMRPTVLATPVIVFDPLAVLPVVLVEELPVLAVLVARTVVPPFGTLRVIVPPLPLRTAGALTFSNCVMPI
jgi:hypothetical protein